MLSRIPGFQSPLRGLFHAGLAHSEGRRFYTNV